VHLQQAALLERRQQGRVSPPWLNLRTAACCERLAAQTHTDFQDSLWLTARSTVVAQRPHGRCSVDAKLELLLPRRLATARLTYPPSDGSVMNYGTIVEQRRCA
jgi:hypothetical protein